MSAKSKLAANILKALGRKSGKTKKELEAKTLKELKKEADLVKGHLSDRKTNFKDARKKSTNIKKKAKGGLIEPTANQTGLKKLPTAVRNKMGYMYGGGMAKKKKMGSMDYRKGGLIIMISEAKTKKREKK